MAARKPLTHFVTLDTKSSSAESAVSSRFVVIGNQ